MSGRCVTAGARNPAAHDPKKHPRDMWSVRGPANRLGVDMQTITQVKTGQKVSCPDGVGIAVAGCTSHRRPGLVMVEFGCGHRAEYPRIVVYRSESAPRHYLTCCAL